MKKTDTHSKNKSLNKGASKKWQTIAIILAATYLVSLFLPFVSPFAQYPLQTIRCLGLPVITSEIFGVRRYILPGDTNYFVTGISGPYFCSAEEAEAAQYSRRLQQN